jgi:phosphate transport system permease protein
MATTGFEADTALRWRRFLGRVFEGTLVAATLFGVLSLVVLFVLVALDALGPFAAEPAWYLLYFVVLVVPVSAYTLFVRRRPAVAAVNDRAFAAVLGTLALSLVAFAIPDAIGPHDALVYFAFTVGPPLAVLAYGRRVRDSHLTGPAVPVSVLVGLAAAALLYDAVVPLALAFPRWLLFYALVTVPVAAGLAAAVRWRYSPRTAGAVAVGVLVGAFGVGFAGVSAGVDPSLWVVLASGFLAPVLVVYGDAFRRFPAGRPGLAGPLVVALGVLAGATLEATFGLAGLDAWLTPTLLVESWSDFRPEQAGIYPQLVGSVMVVGSMAVMAFPVGVGAAIYLEEYAPSTGWQGRLATVLDVNISNLAGVPSVVYGLLGLALFRQGFGLAPGIVVAAGATLGLLILPIVIVSAQEALRSVPDELRQGSYGLGASRWQTVRNVVLPEALPGIMTGTILALGRAIGETAPLVMIGVATTRFSPPEGLFSGATALPLQIFAAKGNNIAAYRTGVVAAAALVLLLLMLTMNATAILVRNRYQNE